MNKITHIIISSFLLFCSVSVSAWMQKYDALEKIYIQTDKPMYVPGDDIYYNLKAVNGIHIPTLLSEKISISLKKPDGSNLYEKEYRLEHGNLTDKIFLHENLPGGIYTFSAATDWMKMQGDSVLYTKEIVVQKYIAPRLLMTMELDKENYSGGELVKADFSVKDLKNTSLSNTEITYFLYADGEEIGQSNSTTDTKGQVELSILLPVGIDAESISLVAKVKYRGQSESISKRVPVITENIDLQFLPEGGFALVGYENTLAFKALAPNGKPADVAGAIVDEEGRIISRFSSFHDGMGKITFHPKEGKSYFAQLELPYRSTDLIPIKEIRNEGVKVEVEQNEEDELIVKVIGDAQKGMTLSLSTICEEKWSKNMNDKSEQKIDIREFSSGIYTLALADEEGVLSERLVYLHPDKGMKVDVQLDKKQYGLRSEVLATVKTTDYNGNPIPAEVCIAAAEDKMISFADDKQAHIVTELMMTSELQGDIHEPNYYFDSIDTEKIAALDLVMLTHGWRSYMKDVDEQAAFAHYHMANSYIGQVIIPRSSIGIETEVLLVNYSKKKAYKVKTDKEGYFSFPLNHTDYFTAYAKSTTGLAYIKKVDLDNLKEYSLDIKNMWIEDMKVNGMVGEIVEEMDDEVVGNKVVNVSLEEEVLLDEVVVVGYAVALIEMDNSSVGSVVKAEAIRSLPTKSINAIAATTAGISVAQDGVISIRGARSDNTIYYVDGIRVNTAIPQSPVQFKEIMMDVDLNKRRLRNMVKSKDERQLARNTIQRRRISGAPKYKFYIPQYTDEQVTERTDFRQTLYWNPQVQTDNKGEAEIRFFTSDEVTSFSVLAEGISISGDVGRGVGKVVTVKPLNADCKLPNFFVLGDTTVLSIVVNNDMDVAQDVALRIGSKNALKIDIIGEDVKTLGAHSSHVFLAKVLATSQESGELQISIQGSTSNDFIKQDFDVLSPYFPMSYSAAGFGSDTFDVVLHDPVPSSISARYRTYNPVQSALTGIESLLRSPSGCFEQVSSSTYPNVMVLQYLNKVGGQERQEFSDKAMKYIKVGYEKLAGYETPVDGFHWWGKAPGNVALTAYGLLEFSDMAKVYQGVDQQMISRTIKYLLDHKDGKGGFELGKGYDGFGNAIYDVQAAYVVYALSQHKNTYSEIKKEYNHAVKNAKKTKDLYQSALLALAAKNMGKENDFEELIEIIKKAINQRMLADVKSANTITRSGKKDNNTETLALCAMALMQDEQIQNQHVLDIINHISTKRNGGRFGSTQATCLSIQAILAYADWKSSSSEGGAITAYIDGAAIQESSTGASDATAMITDNAHTFAAHYAESNSLNYELDIRYESTMPPSAEQHALYLNTRISQNQVNLADQVSLIVELQNTRENPVANPTLVIGIPSGTSLQHKQLKEMLEDEKFDYYEIFENRLVLYFNEMAANEKRKFVLDLKADIKGTFQAPPSKAYLYYDEDDVVWVEGAKCTVL